MLNWGWILKSACYQASSSLLFLHTKGCQDIKLQRWWRPVCALPLNHSCTGIAWHACLQHIHQNQLEERKKRPLKCFGNPESSRPNPCPLAVCRSSEGGGTQNKTNVGYCKWQRETTDHIGAASRIKHSPISRFLPSSKSTSSGVSVDALSKSQKARVDERVIMFLYLKPPKPPDLGSPDLFQGHCSPQLLLHSFSFSVKCFSWVKCKRRKSDLFRIWRSPLKKVLQRLRQIILF